MDDKNTIGKIGEDIATKYLQAKGFTILHRNYRYKKAEIDLIVRKESLLVFVEVKARSSKAWGFPEEAVTQKKADTIILGADQYILDNDWNGEVRFDIISVYLSTPPEIKHFEDAFY